MFRLLDLNYNSNWLIIKILATVFVIIITSFHILKYIAKKHYFINTINMFFQKKEENNNIMINNNKECVVCGKSGSTKQCSACKLVKYCSSTCQSSHWNSGHKRECKNKKITHVQNGQKGSKTVSLVPGRVLSNSIKPPKEILFPYEDFVELYNWDKARFPPCGLLNCGNSCFANVILQCLSCTKPLVAYLLEKSHHKECRRNDWCFLCELQTHIERCSTSRQPFSPLNILSRLPSIGGNLGHGKQEDAHEFMRFAIDTMQSVCLDEFGGEKVLHPSIQETTLIQHIFGGHLQSQVICSECHNVSNQCENMMELNVEIHGDATSLEECLDQFTAREQLHGDNMYKCDGCNDYVTACKRLMVRRAPNILTIALKRFQTGRFGKLNKKVTFPETLDLSPYMIESCGDDVYKLYAVVVHVDMLNASFFGHYICYTKDFHGNWYRIDDCKVSKVDLEDVLSEGAYMLLYSRIFPRPSCLKPVKSSPVIEQQAVKVGQGEEQSALCLPKAESSHKISSIGSTNSQQPDQEEQEIAKLSQGEQQSDECENKVESSHCISAPGTTNSEPMDSVLAGLDFSTSLSDGMEIDDSTSGKSSPHDMDVFSSQNLKSEKDIASTSVCTVGRESLNSDAEISRYVWNDSSTENSQCSKDGNTVKTELSNDDCKSLPISAEFKEELNKMQTENRFLSSSGGKLVNGTKPKPFLNPGFLGKRPINDAVKRRRNGLSNVGVSAHQT